MFSRLERLLEQAQTSKSTLSDIERFNACLAAFDNWTVADFCKHCERLANLEKQSSKRDTQVNSDVVSDFVARFTATRSDRAGVEGLLSDMKADKRIRLAELNAIAHQVVGGTNRYLKKTDAYRDIKLRLDAHLAAERRSTAASEIF